VSWVLTVLGIVFLVLIHEGGHFVAAKAVGMRVERFSLFFPPTLFSVKRGETEYAVGLLPLGGYVKIAGMGAAEAENRATEGEGARNYFSQPVWKRVAVIAAGPAVNLVAAFLILWGVYALTPQHLVPNEVRVAGVERGTPAARALAPGDLLVAVDGRPVRVSESGDNFTAAIALDRCSGPLVPGCVAAKPVTLTVRRQGRIQTFSLRPIYNPQAQRMVVGFLFQYVLAREGPIAAAGSAAREMGYVTERTFTTLARAFTSAKARSQLHGIVGVSDAVSEAFRLSTASALFILALLSLSLALFNLFPFLPLDGGHIFWAVVEGVRRKAVPFWVMERASIVGVALVVGLAVLGLSNDLHALANGSLTVHR